MTNMFTFGEVFLLSYILLGMSVCLFALLGEDEFRNSLFYENNDGFYVNLSIIAITILLFLFWPLGVYCFVYEKVARMKKHLQNRNNKDD